MRDVAALEHMMQDKDVYRYEPQYLPEFKSASCHEFIAEACDRLFTSHDSILLGIYTAKDPERFLGICEIYAYDAEKNKVSLGYRLSKENWHQGIATTVVALAKNYLLEELGISTITAHVRVENVASAKCLLHNGFKMLPKIQEEDWGFAEKILAHKFVLLSEEKSIEQKLTWHKLADAARLLAYGFTCSSSGKYVLKKSILEHTMRVEIFVALPHALTVKVFDSMTEEEYILHRIPEATGAFVGRVREAYLAILTDVVEKCFRREVFTSAAAKYLLSFAKQHYGTEADFPFAGAFNDAAVLRCTDKNKWYAILMTISRSKLGMDSNELVEVVNFHDTQENVKAYLKLPNIYPAYHMNKKYWYTVCLSDLKDAEMLEALVAGSYAYTDKRKGKQVSGK